MLHEFLATHRDELIARCRARVAKRTAPRPTTLELHYGIPLFLEQLIKTLLLEETASARERQNVSGPSEPSQSPVASEIGRAAAKHGSELLRHGLTVDQVVHDYGDLCQAVTELAVEHSTPVSPAELHTLNQCLDNGIADAVTEFGRQRDSQLLNELTYAASERSGNLAHEMRNLLDSAMLAVAAMRGGKVGLTGATGDVLDRSLTGLRNVIDRSLAEVRLTALIQPPLERISVAQLILEVQVAAALEATTRGCSFTVSPVEQGLAVDADRQMLSSAIANLLQNAFKFTRLHSHVSLKAYAAADRVLIDVADECGGLPPGQAEALFRPFEQRGINRTGLGLGLSISRRSVEAIGGELQVRDLPGTGCIFTISLPRK
jgi:signal transduction histidine kinase